MGFDSKENISENENCSVQLMILLYLQTALDRAEAFFYKYFL